MGDAEYRPAGYDWRARFPDAVEVMAGEGAVALTANDAAGYWLIIDGSSCADLFPADVRDELVEVMRFGSAAERDSYLAARASREPATLDAPHVSADDAAEPDLRLFDEQ